MVRELAAENGEYPLLTYVDGLIEDLRGHIPKALRQWDKDSIHQARVATRRLKAALDLMEPVTSKKCREPLGKVLRRLRRRLGPLRDADVMVDHLKTIGRARRPRSAAGWLGAQVAGDRERYRQASHKDTPPMRVLAKLGAYWGYRDELCEAGAAVDSLLAHSVHLQLDAFAEQANRLVGDLHRRERAIARDGSPASGNATLDLTADAPSDRSTDVTGAVDKAPPDAASVGAENRQDPHELRIAGKNLRYTLEMAAVEGHKLPKAVLKAFKQMQEFLGLWHDFVVLADTAMGTSVKQLLAHYEPQLQEQVLDLARITVRKAAFHIGQFARLWAEKGDEVARTIRDTFPLLSPTSEPGDVTAAPQLASPAESEQPQPDVSSLA